MSLNQHVDRNPSNITALSMAAPEENISFLHLDTCDPDAMTLSPEFHYFPQLHLQIRQEINKKSANVNMFMPNFECDYYNLGICPSQCTPAKNRIDIITGPQGNC